MENMQNNDNQFVGTYDIKTWKKWAIAGVALVGVITTIYLAVVYYKANFMVNAHASFCSINDFIDCDSVAKTKDSQFFGIPLALWGMFLYTFIGLMMGAKKLAQTKLFKFMEVFKNPYAYIAALGVISFTISMVLLCISLFQIKKLCIMCVLTYILDLLIGILAMQDYTRKCFAEIFKISFYDFLSALKIKKYLIAFLVVAVCGVAFLTYTSVSLKLAPQVRRINSIQKFIKMNEKKENPYAPKSNILGDENGQVTLEVYSDFRCPICQVFNIIICKTVSELQNVKVVHHQYPLDAECNKYIPGQVHPGACVMALYALAAERQNNYWGFGSQLYLKQPMTDYDVWAIALEQGMDLDKLKADVQDPELVKKLEADIDLAHQYDLHGTPAYSINGGKVNMGILPDFQLKAELIKVGAKSK